MWLEFASDLPIYVDDLAFIEWRSHQLALKEQAQRLMSGLSRITEYSIRLYLIQCDLSLVVTLDIANLLGFSALGVTD